MSNADIVLNATDRMVKCKLAYIFAFFWLWLCRYYITSPAFSSSWVQQKYGHYFHVVHMRPVKLCSRMVVGCWSFDVDKQSGCLCCTAPAMNGHKA